MSKKIAYRFVVRAYDEDILTATEINLRENTSKEKTEKILEETLNDLKNGAIDMYWEKGTIEDGNFEKLIN